MDIETEIITESTETDIVETIAESHIVKAGESPKAHNAGVTGTYKAKTKTKGVNVRNGAGYNKRALVVIPNGTEVKCNGYYTLVDNVKWLLVEFEYEDTSYTGYICRTFLRKSRK